MFVPLLHVKEREVLKCSVSCTRVFSLAYPASRMKTLVGTYVFAAAGSPVDVVAFAPSISCHLLTVCTASGSLRAAELLRSKSRYITHSGPNEVTICVCSTCFWSDWG